MKSKKYKYIIYNYYKSLKLYVWKFILDNEKCNIKIKENDSENTIEIIINGKSNQILKDSILQLNYKQHEFNFKKINNEKIFKLYIDNYCFDDLKEKKNLIGKINKL